MNLTITDPKNIQIFTNLFRYLQFISDHITIEFSHEQLFIQGIDQSHACLFEIIIKKSWFDTYNITTDYTISLSCSFIYRVLNTREDTQMINIAYENDSDILSLSLISDNSNVINKYFELPLINISYERIAIPPCDYQVDFAINSRIIADLVDQLSQFDEQLKIMCNEEHIYMESSGVEGKMRAELSFDDLDEYSIEETDGTTDAENTIVCCFNLKQFKDMCAFYRISDNVTVKLHKDKPIELDFVVDSADSADKLLSVQMFLSPRIVED
jgi:proliferating cell nuclear antigen PCNA